VDSDKHIHLDVDAIVSFDNYTKQASDVGWSDLRVASCDGVFDDA